MTAPLRRPEAAIQRAVFAHYRSRRAGDAFAFHVPNGGWRTPVEGAILKGQGVMAGVPDVVICKGGRFFAMELKARRCKPSAAQQDTIAALEAAGATVAVIDDLDDALRKLEEWQVIIGRTQ